MANECPKCQTKNPDTDKFCGECGTDLSSSIEAPQVTKTIETPYPQFKPGTSIANRYVIDKELGKGGMGEVYLAEDTNLKRQVAIKVLPQPFALDKERLSRFEREARLLAALNHPNIATIHGLEKHQDNQFLVMELIEGETLRERISKGPLPVKEAHEICKQIAEGLESAHEKGIIHRDLKPSNIKLTPEGKVKILDFGIAKAFHDLSDTDSSKVSPITDEVTKPGMVIGTAAYMSPEQAKGKAVDKRTDIWAFGCILFECFTGRRAFEGEVTSETIASILKGEPDWSVLPNTIPVVIKRLMNRCLVKNPRDRLHDIADARIEIESAIAQPFVESSAIKTGWRKKLFASVIISIVLTIAAGLILIWITKKAPKLDIAHTTIELPEGMHITRNERYIAFTEISLSHDGRSVFFSANPDGDPAKAMLYVRPLEKIQASPIPGTEGGRAPFLSPDGQWLGFWAQNQLKKVQISSNAIPIPICENSFYPQGATWSTNGKIIIGTSGEGLHMVDSNGGILTQITIPDKKKESSHVLPCFIPNTNIVIFTVKDHLWGTSSHIEALNLDSGERKVLIEDGADARFIPTGHLVFMQESTLMAIPFDSGKLLARGSSVPILEGVFQSINAIDSDYNSGAGQFQFSESGDLVYASGGIFSDPENHIAWVDQAGKIEPIETLDKLPILSFRLSPDGRYLAYRTVGQNANIWIHDLSRKTSSRLTREGRAMFLSWTPDGERITFGYSEAGDTNIFWIPVNEGEPPEKIVESDFPLFPGSWSPGGQYLVYVEDHPQTSQNIWIYQREEQSSIPLFAEDYAENYPELSPDGRYIAYCSNETGRSEVYVTSFPSSGRKILISTEGGLAPLWSPDGRMLYFWSLDWNELIAVEITTKPMLSAKTPNFLFSFQEREISYLRPYDITVDGSKFLLLGREAITPIEIERLNLVQNWFGELKRLVPAKK